MKDLYDELEPLGQQKPWPEERKHKIAVTTTEVIRFAGNQTERQMYQQPLPRADAKSAAKGLNTRSMLNVVFVREVIVVFLVNVVSRPRERHRSTCSC